MALFADSSNVDEIRELMSWGVISGVTTNPKILADEGLKKSLKETLLEIVAIMKASVSVELTEMTLEGMLRQAEEFASWDREHITIKVPHTSEGLKAVNVLERQRDIRTNMTVMMNFNQAYLAGLAGATYVSLFVGRIRDMGYDPAAVVASVRDVFDREGIPGQIIAGSIRHPADVEEAIRAGAHIVTVTPAILHKLTWNPRTDSTIAEFNTMWEKVKKTGKV